MGSNQQPLESKSYALPTALPRKICEVRFKQLLYSAIVKPQFYTSLQNRAVDQLNQTCTFIKTEILPLLKLEEIYVHIYYNALNNIFYIKLLCMHDATTCNIGVIL